MEIQLFPIYDPNHLAIYLYFQRQFSYDHILLRSEALFLAWAMLDEFTAGFRCGYPDNFTPSGKLRSMNSRIHPQAHTTRKIR